jgi:integrase/recombinase XerD
MALPANPRQENDLDRFLAQVNRWSLGQLSPNTANTYHGAVSRLNTIARAMGRLDLAMRPALIGPGEAAEIVMAMRQVYSPSTIGVTLSALTGLWDAWAREGGPKDNPWKTLRRPRPEQRVAHKILTRDQVHELLASARDRYCYALMATLYYLGLRVSEAIELQWGDLFRGEGETWVTIFGKREKTRQVPVPPHLMGAWKELGKRQDKFSRILIDQEGKPWTRYQAFHVVRQHARALGFGDVSPHWLRHSAAAHLLECGRPINEVQAWLGHANLATTSVYVRIGVPAEIATVL